MSKIIIDARIIKSSTGRYIERLLKYLQEIDDVNRYVILLRDKQDWRPDKKNFKVVEAPFADFSFAEQLKLRKLLKQLKPDLVHFAMPQYPILYFGRRINTIHDLIMIDYKHKHWHPIVDTIKRIVFKFVFFGATRAKKVLVPTRFVKTQIVRRYRVDPKNVVVTYESAEKLAADPKEYRPMKNKKFIFYVGNMAPHKNIGRLIQAFDLVASKRPELHLVLVGKEGRFHPDLKKVVDYYGVKNVHFTGYMHDSKLAWLYTHAQAYVFPSLSEGFGLPGLEALQYDCPLISSNGSCLPEVYGNAAAYFNPKSIEDMAEVIHEVLGRSNIRKKLVDNGKKQREFYSWRKMAAETKSVYDSILS